MRKYARSFTRKIFYALEIRVEAVELLQQKLRSKVIHFAVDTEILQCNLSRDDVSEEFVLLCEEAIKL